MTGTPGGVALHLSPEVFNQLSNPFLPGDKRMELIIESQKENPKYLKEGDVIRCEIKSPDSKIDLGVQENKVVAAPNPTYAR